MILLLSPAPPFISWCALDGEKSLEGKCDTGSAGWCESLVADLQTKGKIETAGYMLYNGGEDITKAAATIKTASFKSIERSVKFLPEYNDLTYKAVKAFSKKLPEALHVLFCDTALFSDLPEEASNYALPYGLRKKGIRRYGGYGLFHEYAWTSSRSSREKKNPERLISVYLGDHPNIAAIRKGRAIETSMGFTTAEGLPSAGGSGDIDPTIIFELSSKGMSFKEINELLSSKSGFRALAGKKCGFPDLAAARNGNEARAREVLIYDILKYIGAYVSVLGGLDSLVFIGDELRSRMDLIKDICRNLDFLGVNCENTIRTAGKRWFLTAPGAGLEISCVECVKWDIMAHGIRNLIKQEL